MSKSSCNVNRAFMHKSIPYRYCYEEGGMIETEQGRYTRTYLIRLPQNMGNGCCNSQMVLTAIEKIMQRLSREFVFEFTVRNRLINEEAYLKEIVFEQQEDIFEEQRGLYNKSLQESSKIGHNNCRRENYLTLQIGAESPDRALEEFKKAEEALQKLFREMYLLELCPLSLEERLELLHGIYHPATLGAEFVSETGGSKIEVAEMEGTETEGVETEVTEAEIIKAESAAERKSENRKKQKRMNTKDRIAPEVYSCRERDYMVVEDMYARTFFISYIPKHVSENVLLDISSVSAHSILSIHCEGLETDLGLGIASHFVNANTEVKSIPIRETVQDRREKRMETYEEYISEEDEAYFHQAALAAFKQAKEREHSLVQTAILITLFGKTKEELDRDTGLLALCAGKYACQIRCLELLQNESFQSVLPLCNLRVNVSRVLSTHHLASMPLFSLQDIFEQSPMFYGLNALNDNLLLLDRRNYPTGMIAGAEGSGKTTAVKREAAGILFGTEDEVVILAKYPDEYRTFAEKLQGKVVESRDAWEEGVLGSQRITVVGFDKPDMLLMRLDSLWNYALLGKQKNRNVRLYVDTVDELFYTSKGSKYLTALLETAGFLQISITLVIGSAVHLIVNPMVLSGFHAVTDKIHFFKLLSMGPVERKFFGDRLNIVQQLQPYLVDRLPGEGILVTASLAVAFYDRFDVGDETYSRLFQ